MGPVFAAANFGVLVGSLIFSVVADRIGRRPVLIGATLFFSVMALATSMAPDVRWLLALRFIAGIGMGCIMPNATALIGEYSPKRQRVTLMMCITVGFTGGAAVAGFVANLLIPAFGWRSVFVAGGAIPLVVALAMIWGLPESLTFLAVRKRNLAAIGRSITELDPSIRVGPNTEFVANEEKRTGVPFVYLFREGRGATTVLLWLVNFMNLLNLYSLSNWLPTLVTSMGYAQRAVLVGTILQVGGTIAAFGLAWLIARLGFIPTLTATFVMASISIALIGQPGISLALLFVIVFVAGWCVIGGQPGLNALSATYYPTDLRSTGVGWGLGVGRLGAIVGPYVVGRLVAAQWTTQQMFSSAALMALLTAIAVFALRYTMNRTGEQERGAAPGMAPVAH
jgi:AAHS family 4-hydroxybenzoate transporter-like MFS transporter